MLQKCPRLSTAGLPVAPLSGHSVILGVSTTALAAVPGDPFKLGRVNAVDRISTLIGSASGAMLRVENDGFGTALACG